MVEVATRRAGRSATARVRATRFHCKRKRKKRLSVGADDYLYK